IHSFFIPAFRVKQDVLPGRSSSVWFEATKPGRYHLFCAEYCGTDHSRMIGSVVVMEAAEYSTWLDSQAEGAPALEGRKVFLKYRCISCHAADGQAHAPLLENLYGKPVLLTTGEKVIADDSYLRESILYPKAKVVAGYQPIMPTFKGQLSEEENVQLIAWMRTLGPGQTPTRVEQTPPPIE
ncbi:MAG: c-type cytochrome, partial [Gemmataceae bacterium]